MKKKKQKITGIIVNGEAYKIQRTKSTRMCSLCDIRTNGEELPNGRVKLCALCLVIDEIIGTGEFYFKKQTRKDASHEQ